LRAMKVVKLAARLDGEEGHRALARGAWFSHKQK